METQPTAHEKTKALEDWFVANGGHFRKDIQLSHSDSIGLHLRASKDIRPGSTTASAPHSLALSYLNALVDDRYPVFRKQRQRFKCEAIGFWYLAFQYLDRKRSFWGPYLESLLCPEDAANEGTQPMFWEREEDMRWLRGTDVWHTVSARKEVYWGYYNDGLTILDAAGMNVGSVTWHLFKWATTIYASRSFTSLSLLSAGSKYRTAFKSSPDGRRQAVLLDVSRWPAEDLDFPVLFPGLDAANHSHDARVHWSFDPGRFSISLDSASSGSSNDDGGLQAGAEFFNNYGPKDNGELLIGYGFCLGGNPYDTVALTPKPPPEDLRRELRVVQPGYFDSEGDWSAEKATFRIRRPSPAAKAEPLVMLAELPEPLLELLLYLLRHERRLPFTFVSEPAEYLTSAQSDGRRYLPHIARMLVQFLSAKSSSLKAVNLPPKPGNARQRYADIYRRGQLQILDEVIEGLRGYVRGLVYNPAPANGSELGNKRPKAPSLIKLEDLLQLLEFDADFLDGVAVSANTKDIEQLRLAGWEDDIWVLLLCYALLGPGKGIAWLRDAMPEYFTRINLEGSEGIAVSAEEVSQAGSLTDIVSAAALALPGSRWGDSRWSPKFLAAVGGRTLQHESFTVMCPGLSGEEARLCVYLHVQKEKEEHH